MTQRTMTQPSRHQLFQRFLLAQGLGWLGSMGVLSSGIALAQTPDLVIPAETESASSQPLEQAEPTIAPEPAAPESFPPVELVPTPSLEAPPVVLQRPAAGPVEQDSYDAPSSVVLSERSTGCQAVVQSGQSFASDPCAPEPRWQAPITARWHGGQTSNSGSVAAMSVGALSVTPTGMSLGTTASVQDYYKRTIRPPGRLGNGNIRLMFPLSIPAPISSIFGWRVHPITGDQRFHSGTDLAAPMGTPVLAALAGRVAIADLLGGYGLAVTVEHNKGTQQTLYAHLSEIFVKPGELVKQGDVIGRVGSTGNSTGPHLHFEFRQLTPDGWVALDAGQQLEYGLAQLVKALQVAEARPANRS